MQFELGTVITRKGRPDYWTASFYIDGKRCRKSFSKQSFRTKGEVCRRLLEEARELTVRKGRPLKEVIEEFFSVNSRSIRPGSVTNYRLHLNRLVAAYGDSRVEKVTLADLEVWVSTFEETGVSPATVNQAIRTLRRFWNWAEARGDVPKNVAKGLRHRRVPEKIAVALTEEEIPRFLENCTSSFRPIAELALHTGLRLGEVINLKWSAVDLEHGIILIRNDGDFRTKSGKQRVVPLHPQLVKALAAIERKSEYVFCNDEGKRRADKTSWFRMSVRDAAVRAGIDRKLNFHSLRHTFATRLAMYAGDMEAARRILGHSDVQTTRGYVHPTEQLVRAVEKLPELTPANQSTGVETNPGQNTRGAA